MQISKLALVALMAMPFTASTPSRPELMIQPYVSVALGGYAVKGNVTEGQVLASCEPVRESRTYADHDDKFLYLECDGGIKLEINNIMFDSSVKIPVHIVKITK